MSGTRRPLFVVWTGYQRRAVVLAGRLGADLVALRHRFRGRWLRPIDYLEKALRTFLLVARRRPPFVVVQVPPPFATIPVRWAGARLVVDAHNAALEGRWARLPGARAQLRQATVCLAHNDVIVETARERFPEARWITVYDPVPDLADRSIARDASTVLFIGSFGADEPVDLLLEVVARMPEKRFLVTADPARLPAATRAALSSLANVTMTGFLPEPEYHALLRSCGAALVLSTRAAVQPSGACEALAADTPLVVSETPLTRALFGGWAHTVRNEGEDVAAALADACGSELDLADERRIWSARVEAGLAALCGALEVHGTAMEGMRDG